MPVISGHSIQQPGGGMERGELGRGGGWERKEEKKKIIRGFFRSNNAEKKMLGAFYNYQIPSEVYCSSVLMLF